jgi:hypothetical protein
MLVNWTERFSTNWSYTFLGSGGFDVDTFISRTSLTSTVASAEANIVTSRVFTANLVTGLRNVTTHNADLRGGVGTNGVDATLAVYNNSDFRWLRSGSGVVAIDAAAVLFSRSPVFANGSPFTQIIPMVGSLASGRTSIITNGISTPVTLWVDAALPPISNYFAFGSQVYYSASTNGVYSTYIGLHSAVLKAGPLLRISTQTGWYPRTSTNAAVWYVGGSPVSKFDYSILSGTNVVMTRVVSNGVNGAIETGPAFGILDTMKYIASTNVELRVLTDEVNLDRPMVVRVSIDLVEGMEACDE